MPGIENMILEVIILIVVILLFWLFFRYALIDPSAPFEHPSYISLVFAVVIGISLLVASIANVNLSIDASHALLGFLVISAVAPPKHRDRLDGEPWIVHWLKGIPDRLKRIALHKLFGLFAWVLAIAIAPIPWTLASALLVIPVMHWKTAEIFETAGIPIDDPDPRRKKWQIMSYLSAFSFIAIWAVGVFTLNQEAAIESVKWSVIGGVGLGALVYGFANQ